MDQIQTSVNQAARRYGAEVVDVRIKRADLPAGPPLDSAFERMRTARRLEAASIRAQGYKQAQIIRADADAKAAGIYAESLRKAAEFDRKNVVEGKNVDGRVACGGRGIIKQK